MGKKTLAKMIIFTFGKLILIFYSVHGTFSAEIPLWCIYKALVLCISLEL